MTVPLEEEREGHAKREAEIVVMQPQAKDHCAAEAGRVLPSSVGGSTSLLTP